MKGSSFQKTYLLFLCLGRRQQQQQCSIMLPPFFFYAWCILPLSLNRSPFDTYSYIYFLLTNYTSCTDLSFLFLLLTPFLNFTTVHITLTPSLYYMYFVSSGFLFSNKHSFQILRSLMHSPWFDLYCVNWNVHAVAKSGVSVKKLV